MSLYDDRITFCAINIGNFLFENIENESVLLGCEDRHQKKTFVHRSDNFQEI